MVQRVNVTFILIRQVIKNSIMFNGFWEDARPFELICLGLKEYKELNISEHPEVKRCPLVVRNEVIIN